MKVKITQVLEYKESPMDEPVYYYYYTTEHAPKTTNSMGKFFIGLLQFCEYQEMLTKKFAGIKEITEQDTERYFIRKLFSKEFGVDDIQIELAYDHIK